MVVVNNASELTTELNNATGGELIELAAGVNFGRFNTPSGKSYSSPVTITSENDNNRGVFEQLQINSGNVHLTNFNIQYIWRSGDFQFEQALLVYNSPNTVCDGLRVLGNQVDGGGEITGWAGDWQSISDTNASHTVRNCYFEGFDNGIRFLFGANILFEDVEMSGMGADGLDPTGVKGMTIRRFYAHDWQTPRPSAHIDYIQLLRHASTGGCEDILIDRCTCDQGNGYYQQGIWAGADGFDTSNDFNRHKRVTIQDTKLVTGHANGISIDGIDDFVIRRTMLLPGPFSLRDPITGGIPLINMNFAATGTVLEDTLHAGILGSLPGDNPNTNNYQLARADIGGANLPAPNVGDVDGFNDYQIASGAYESGGRQAGPLIANRIGGWTAGGVAPHATYQALPAGFQGGQQGLPVMPAGSVAAQITRG